MISTRRFALTWLVTMLVASCSEFVRDDNVMPTRADGEAFFWPIVRLVTASRLEGMVQKLPVCLLRRRI